MSRLVHAFPMPLGGEGLSGGKPWVTNLMPSPNAQDVSLVRPVCLSFRDAETYVNPGQLLIEVGYAKAHAFATSVDAFDKIPRTKKVSLQVGIVHTEATYGLVADGIRIQKTINGAQRSTYATAIPAGSGYPSAMISAVVRPGDISSSGELSAGPLNASVFPGPLLELPYSAMEVAFASGTVIGLEHGPRNKAVYLFLCVIGGAKYLQLTSYRPSSGNPLINLTTPYEWGTGFHRYTIVWNETYEAVEVYADYLGSTTRVFRVPFSSIPDMPVDYYARFAKPTEIVGTYGQEGVSGDNSIWKNIALTTDVGYPILGNIHTGNFQTKVWGSELLKTTGERDPRDLDIACWHDAPSSLFANRDSAAKTSNGDGVFKMTKPTLGKTFAIYREEPGLLRSNTDGFMVEARMVAKPTKQDTASTGMGVAVFDGRNYFQIVLFDDFRNKSVGVMKRFGDAADISSYYFPTVPIDWSKTGFRFTVDPRHKRMKFYALSDLSTPLMDITFDRALLPTGEDMGLGTAAPFVAFGHVTPTDSNGTLELHDITVCHLFQEWESRQGLAPDHISLAGDAVRVDPRFTLVTHGSTTQGITDGVYRIQTSPDTTVKLHRAVSFARNRGGAVEACMRITSQKTRTQTGVALILDDGNTAFTLSFVETSIGKFAVLPLRDGFGGFQFISGRDGQGAKLSFACNWSQFHTYRLEKTPYDGLRVFMDGELKLVYPEGKTAQLPDEQFSGSPSIGFGHFTGDIAVSEWKFVRGFFSGGYEISFKKNKTDRELRQELFGTQAIVVAYAEDQ